MLIAMHLHVSKFEKRGNHCAKKNYFVTFQLATILGLLHCTTIDSMLKARANVLSRVVSH